jgi:hypothetical protein
MKNLDQLIALHQVEEIVRMAEVDKDLLHRVVCQIRNVQNCP